MYGVMITSLVAFVLVNISWVKKRGTKINCTIGSLAIAVGMLTACVSPVTGATILLIGLTACLFPVRRTRFIGTLVVMCTAFALSLLSIYQNVSKFRAVRDQYPVESMSERLSYEKSRPGGGPSFALSPSTEERLERREALNDSFAWGARQRKNTLEFMHKSLVQQFADYPGFGVGRMARFSRPSLASLEVNEEIMAGNLERASRISEQADQQADSDSTSLYSLHFRNSVEFANPFSLGFAKSRDYVVGFQPHALHKKFAPPETDHSLRLSKVELISLLKFSSPMVYQSDELPAMNLLKDAPTRDPDSFEEEAIATLQKGEDLVTRKSDQGLRVLGSLRAAKECMNCHDVNRGELLGAFSYRFKPAGSK